MVRTLILNLLLITATRLAVADETAKSTPAATTALVAVSVPAANVRATGPTAKATKPGAKKRATSTRAGDHNGGADDEGGADDRGGADDGVRADDRDGADDKGGPLPAAGHAMQPGDDVKMSGMSILGNEDAPKSLVLVPWKSSQLADMPTVSRLLDSAAQPVDKDVFMRELAYYEFKSSSK